MSDVSHLHPDSQFSQTETITASTITSTAHCHPQNRQEASPDFHAIRLKLRLRNSFSGQRPKGTGLHSTVAREFETFGTRSLGVKGFFYENAVECWHMVLEREMSGKKAPFKSMAWDGVLSVPTATCPVYVWLPFTKQDRANEVQASLKKLNKINEASNARSES